MQNGYRRKANVEQHRIQSDYDTMPRKPKPPRNLILKKKKTAANKGADLVRRARAVAHRVAEVGVERKLLLLLLLLCSALA